MAKFSCSPGQVIAGRYRVTEPLASGGMGEVYAVEHLAVGRQFALKLLRPALVDRDSSAVRFERETRAASVLHSIHIVPIIDRGQTEDGIPFFVMELLHGEDLGRSKSRALPSPALAAEIVRQAAAGAEVAHRHGIVHRDIKPANIFLVPGLDGTPLVKLLDFGVAKLDASLAGAGTSTKTGAVLGTASYMSPEQARGQIVDARSDVYSLGVVLYELLTGRRPFDGDSYNATMYRVLTQNVQPIAELRKGVAPGLQAAVERAMARAPDQRFQSAADFAGALAPFARGFESAWVALPLDHASSPSRSAPTGTVAIEETPPSLAPKRAARWPARLAVGVGAVIVVAAALAFTRIDSAPRPGLPAGEVPRAVPPLAATESVPVAGPTGEVASPPRDEIHMPPPALSRSRGYAKARPAKAPYRSVESDAPIQPKVPEADSATDEFVRRNPYAR